MCQPEIRTCKWWRWAMHQPQTLQPAAGQTCLALQPHEATVSSPEIACPDQVHHLGKHGRGQHVQVWAKLLPCADSQLTTVCNAGPDEEDASHLRVSVLGPVSR